MFSRVSLSEIPVYVHEDEARVLSCEGCTRGEFLDFDFTMAFQPIVDLAKGHVHSYEALVRGLEGEPAWQIIDQVTAQNIYKFDQTCRVKAIALAAQAKLGTKLNINFMPGAVYRPDICIKTTLAAAEKYGFPLENITFEVVETEMIKDINHLGNIIQHYQEIGFTTALDDFGTGYSNLDALADLQPDIIKADMRLVRDIDTNKRRQAIVKSLIALATELGIEVVAEGVETAAQRDCLMTLGVMKQQGYYFAKPALEAFEDVPQHKMMGN